MVEALDEEALLLLVVDAEEEQEEEAVDDDIGALMAEEAEDKAVDGWCCWTAADGWMW